MRFKLVNSTIRYIYDTKNLKKIICYSDIFPFFKHYYHCNIYAIILIVLHHTSVTSRCLFFVICNTFVVRKTGKNATIHGCRLIISYTLPKYGQIYVFVIYIHKCKCNTLIFILMLFCLSHQKHIQDKTR